MPLSEEALQNKREYNRTRMRTRRADGIREDCRRTPKTWARMTLASLKYRAKQRGLPFDLTKDDLVLPVTCPVLGIPIIVGAGQNAHPNCPSVDRLDNSLGYTKDNIFIISNRANLLKKDATVDELKALVRYMEEAK